MKTGSTSFPARPTLDVDILDGLITHVIDQFLSMMKYGIELVLSGHTSFEFGRSLLKNYIENIRKVRGSERAKVYQARMEQLGSYSLDLQNLESTNLVIAAHLVLGNLRAEQEHLHEEAEKEIAKKSVI